MNAAMTHVLNFEGSQLQAEFHELAVNGELDHQASASWSTEGRDFPAFPADASILHTFAGTYKTIYIVRRAEEFARVEMEEGRACVTSAASTSARATEMIEWVREIQPPSDPEDGMAEVAYWAYGQHGPKCVVRQIAAPSWSEVKDNYRGDALVALERMMGDFQPGVGGQLLLWTGKAGTGKTTALRALAQEWGDWCKLHYITDPEKLFGTRADYLLDVALNEIGTKSINGEPAKNSWRLLVLEDSGELMRKDAAEVTGKALSRLLNTVDGMLGQGLRIMVLVTTNEELGKLHEAIARPGRCAVQIEFAELNGDEAESWRLQHGITHDERPYGAATLAELYAELEGFRTNTPIAALGFGT